MAGFLPLFPLGTPLMPHAVLALHVFEPRYLALMDDLIGVEGDGGPMSFGNASIDAAALGIGSRRLEFGVVMIARGSEVGGGEVRTNVGTRAQVIAAHRLDDGRWAIATVGTRRFEVTEWWADDPYPQGLVEEVGDEPAADEPGGSSLPAVPAVAGAERLVRRTLALAAELGEPVPGLDFRLDRDSTTATWQLCGLAPFGPLDRQQLLEIRSPAERLRVLVALAADLEEVFAFRLAGR